MQKKSEQDRSDHSQDTYIVTTEMIHDLLANGDFRHNK